MRTVSFLVDGFNLYHSLDELQKMSGASVKWLDLHALCSRYLQAVRGAVGGPVELRNIYWFSARPEFLRTRKPDALARFDTYERAVRHSGVKVQLSQFKRKDRTCPKCGHSFSGHEEKETDVAMALKLVEVCATAECDTAVLVSGDTDLIPAIRTTQRLVGRKVGVAFPFLRHNAELSHVADYSFKINQKDLQKAQFPSPLSIPGGSIVKPASW